MTAEYQLHCELTERVCTSAAMNYQKWRQQSLAIADYLYFIENDQGPKPLTCHTHTCAMLKLVSLSFFVVIIIILCTVLPSLCWQSDLKAYSDFSDICSGTCQ